MPVDKRQRREKHENGTKEGPRTGVRTSQTALLASLI